MKKTLLLTCLVLVFHAISAQSSWTEKIEMKPALLVVDVQNQFLSMASQEDQASALNWMNWTIMVFRMYDLPVIRVYHTSEEFGPIPGTPEFEFPDTLQVTENDPQIVKTYPSAFNKTGLFDLLEEKGINTLFICGLSSTGCVLATYFDAMNYDFEAFLVKDAMLGPEAVYTNNVEAMFNALDLNTVNFMLRLQCGDAE
ncbi:MAG: cysteine hydrolase [Bacteroidetes bacterium]|nr:cysteine hydrolase [Bacteroidota bacterium]